MPTIGIHDLPLFIATGVLLNITPGQDTLYIVGRSIAQGRRAGILSALGISTGCVFHILAASFGLAALLAASAAAFQAVKLAGAGYLFYLGIRMLIGRSHSFDEAPAGAASAWSIYRTGMLTNVLNPKVALFFLAFLPQFVAPSAPSKAAAFLVLGAVFLSTGTIWCLIVAWFASAVGTRLRERPSLGRRLQSALGALFVGLGLKLAFSRS